MRKIRVLFVIGQLSVGGTELQLLQLAGNLNQEFFEPMVVCLSSGSEFILKKFREKNVPVVLLERETCGRFITLWKLAHIVIDFKPLIVHAFAYASRAAIPIAKIFSRCKTIVSIRTQPSRQLNYLDKLFNSLSDMVLTNSQRAAESISFCPWRSVPIQVIYNGIDLHNFDGSNESVVLPTLRKGNNVICAVARLHPVKGLDVLLNAFAILSKTMDNVQLWIVGEGQEKRNLENLAIRLGVDSKVIFWGQQEKISSILKHVDIGVLSSNYEGLPNAVIEYMAAGIPVVATNVGGVGEIVVHQKTGFLVPVNNVEAMAKSLLTMLHEPELLRHFGEAGRQRVEKLLGLERMIRETETIYKDLLTG